MLKKNRKFFFLSLVLFNEKYINIFFKFSFLSIIKNIDNLCTFNGKDDTLITLNIHTTKKDSSLIKKKIERFNIVKSNFFNYKIIEDINNNYSVYKTLGVAQVQDLHFAKNNQYDYLIFLYADLIFSPKSFADAFRYCIKLKHIKVVTTFALELLLNHRKFNSFFKFLLDSKIKKCFEYIYKFKLISKYHKSFKIGKFYPQKSFFYKYNKNNFLLKSFDHHPLLISLKKIKFNKKLLAQKIVTIDKNFFPLLNIDYHNIYCVADLKKISIFSITPVSRLNLDNCYDKIFKIYKFLELYLLKIKYLKSDIISQQLFLNKIFFLKMTSTKSIEENFFVKRSFLKLEPQKFLKIYCKNLFFVFKIFFFFFVGFLLKVNSKFFRSRKGLASFNKNNKSHLKIYIKTQIMISYVFYVIIYYLLYNKYFYKSNNA